MQHIPFIKNGIKLYYNLSVFVTLWLNYYEIVTQSLKKVWYSKT